MLIMFVFGQYVNSVVVISLIDLELSCLLSILVSKMVIVLNIVFMIFVVRIGFGLDVILIRDVKSRGQLGV